MSKLSTVCFNIKSSWHIIAKMYNEQAAQHGLSSSVAYVLLSIDEQEGTPATHIGPLVGMESRSLTRMLSTLEQANLIYRLQDNKDKRLVRILLTEEGKAKKEIAKAVIRKFNTAVKSTVPKEKLITFFEVISQINQIANEHKRNHHFNTSEI
ncbi:MAG: MarR family transcriptional regulator [Cytophagales bacterium]|nr:MAG: MarR family transcriptional regulator [Cytophagales bacterium]